MTDFLSFDHHHVHNISVLLLFFIFFGLLGLGCMALHLFLFSLFVRFFCLLIHIHRKWIIYFYVFFLLSFSFFLSLFFNSLFVCSASGCPIANRNKLRALEMENVVEKQRAYVTNIPPSIKIDGVNCPTLGCDNTENINSIYVTHRSFSGLSTAQGVKRTKFDDNGLGSPRLTGGRWIHFYLFIYRYPCKLVIHI